MGAGGVPNKGNAITVDRRLERHGKPNSRVDRYKNGKKVQSRWHDEKGNALRNIDYSHSGKNLPFPHDHKWEYNNGFGERGEEHLAPDFENYPDI